jgi:hypothetical protein
LGIITLLDFGDYSGDPVIKPEEEVFRKGQDMKSRILLIIVGVQIVTQVKTLECSSAAEFWWRPVAQQMPVATARHGSAE